MSQDTTLETQIGTALIEYIREQVQELYPQMQITAQWPWFTIDEIIATDQTTNTVKSVYSLRTYHESITCWRGEPGTPGRTKQFQLYDPELLDKLSSHVLHL